MVLNTVETIWKGVQGIVNSFLTLDNIFYIGVGFTLLMILFFFIKSSQAYECKLDRSVNRLNEWLFKHQTLNENNLMEFNNLIKDGRSPKILRKHWQQFMLYRENNASFYMSFENCVEIPLRNSKFKRDKIIMNMFAYILAGTSLILNTYLTAETADVAFALQRIFLAPIVILLINYIVSIVLDLKESAIINDLNQNYQYFETNIDKATKSLPEYVDYEILFDKQEIKKGIPILYQYLQKRAEEEQRELELARLKNVEHEKFNFDEAGLAGSLVLERAMQEAENYIAERKKYNQDIEQINSEITQEDMNYREATKEYNRQMQVSKETFANFKQQLEQVSSTIEANYLKKQQQQELDRQRNLERDFDTATDRHKKVIESYQAELDSIDNFIAESRKRLQDAMMAEFATYSGKVYNEAKKVVDEREKEKYLKVKQEIKSLEEELYAKNKQLENVNQESSHVAPVVINDKQPEDVTLVETIEESSNEDNQNIDFNFDTNDNLESTDEKHDDNSWNFADENSENKDEDSQSNAEGFETMSLADFDKQNENSHDDEYQSYSDFLKEQNIEPFNFDPNSSDSSEEDKNSGLDWETEESNKSTVQEDESTQKGENFENKSSEEDDDEGFEWFDELLLESEEDEETEKDDEVNEEEINDNEETEEDDKFGWFDNLIEKSSEDDDEDGALEIKPEFEKEVVVKKKAGRPRKIVTATDNKPKRKPGRPKKAAVENENKPTEKKRGRPRKVEVVAAKEATRKPGRPKKIELAQTQTKVKKGRGRPKKIEANVEVKEEKRGRGRPKKKKAGRPRKVVQEAVVEDKPKKKVGRPKKENQNVNNDAVKRKAGRPKKVNLDSIDGDVDLEAYLKVIDNAIAKENAKIKRSQRALENNANIKTKKKK